MKESILEFQKLQSVRLDPKLTNAGNRKSSDSQLRYLRLSNDYWRELKEALRTFLDL